MRLTRLAQALTFTTAALILTACGDDDNSNDTPSISDVTPPLLTTNSDFANRTIATAGLFLSGQAQDTGGVKSLTYQLNDQPAQNLTLDTDGNFDDNILLALGDNKITLTATDNVGNIMRVTKTIYLGDTIAAGGSHTGALKDGKLYGWGRNNYGQTGLGVTTSISDAMGHPNTPMLINSAPSNLRSIGFNQNHSLAIDQNGKVYSWGEDKLGQLGRGDNNRNDCTKSMNDCRLDISAIAEISNAVMIAPGYSHNLILTQDGTVWAFGANAQGQLGNGDSNDNADSSTPIKVDFSAASDIGHIVQVVASANSSYALDDKGQVWGWGSNAYANFGDGQQCNKANNCVNINATPKLIKIINIDDNSANNSANNNAKDDIDNGAEKVTQLAAGRDHVLALTNKESVYGWGLNASSQVGYNGKNYSNTDDAWDNVVTTPTKLSWFTDKEVNRVYANGNASYVLLDNGKVYPWGMFGETDGTGKTIYTNLDEPTDTLPSLTDINNMAMGAMHLIAQEKTGALFTWGWSFEGSLGSKDATHIWMYNNPIPVSLPKQL